MEAVDSRRTFKEDLAVSVMVRAGVHSNTGAGTETCGAILPVDRA